jgi:SAM-dependent methyltransferase
MCHAALPQVASRFVRLCRDDVAEAFLLRCGGRSAAVRWAQSAATSALRATLSLTDANGLVGRGSMHVLSTAQARTLLQRPLADADAAAASGDAAPRRGVLLDVGAGDGSVTAQLAPLFDAVVATEVSAPMVRRLRARSFQAVVLTADVSRGVPEAAAEAGVTLARAPDGAPRFDCVALLNVLDRCDTPRTLLAQLRDLLLPGTGRLLLAVVLPFRPFVEDGTARRPPAEPLHLPPNASFEASLSALWSGVLQPLGALARCVAACALRLPAHPAPRLHARTGFQLEAVSRVPYMSDGDTRCPVYVLDDVLLVLSVPPQEAPAGEL